MNRMFKRIGEQINKSPVKVLLATMLLFALLITGVTSIMMATGNETLVQSDNSSIDRKTKYRAKKTNDKLK